MEVSENYQLLKELFYKYVTLAIPSLGAPREKVVLGAFVALLAVKFQKIEQISVSNLNDREDIYYELISDFEISQLIDFIHNLEELYVIPHGWRALDEYLYEVTHLKIDIQIELSDLLDSILEAESPNFGSNETPRGLSNLLFHAIGVKAGEVVFDPAMGSGAMLYPLNSRP